MLHCAAVSIFIDAYLLLRFCSKQIALFPDQLLVASWYPLLSYYRFNLQNPQFTKKWSW